MFKSDKKQYINILKENKQLKLDYKTFQDSKITKHEQSSFLITDDNLPNEALFKIESLEKNIKETYLVAMYEGVEQKIIPKNQNDNISFQSSILDSNNEIVVPKNKFNSNIKYYQDSGIDFLFSPYNIINEYINNNKEKNTLNILIHNNIIYAMVTDKNQTIAYSTSNEITPFENIKEDDFYDDDLVGQKVFDEVHFLEIQQLISDIAKNYYDENDDVDFLEKINLFYTLKTLTPEQIAIINETMMLELNYKQINLEDYFDILTQKIDANSYSFVDIREPKKTNNNIYMWLGLSILSIVIAYFVLVNQISEEPIVNETQNKTKPKDEVKNKKIEKKENLKKEIKSKEIVPVEVEPIIMLPNHSLLNKQILENIFMLLEVVPYNAVLKDLDVQKDGSTFVTNFIFNEPDLEEMQTKLKNIYKDSNLLLKNRSKTLVTTIIENKDSNILKQNIIENIEYKKYAFVPISKATKYLDGISSIKSNIKFISKDKDIYTTFNFTIKSIVETPQQFFDFVSSLDKQDLSITLEYPVSFSKLNNGLEVKYKLKVHQLNKKQVQLKK
ncbi:MAG: hypothetical protein U9R37_04680 [Campylobacterota bacterium]|nr:hypothetical protein [Campylobacterota bacterium]